MTSISPSTFHHWAIGLQRSDQRAFTSLYDATYDSLHRFVWYITRDDEATQDVLQDVYIKLWSIRESVDETKSLKAFLYQIARNFALNHLRSARRHLADALDAEGAEEPAAQEFPIEDRLDAHNLEALLNHWIEELPPRRREAFRLSRHEQLSHDEIASIMELTPKTVNNHIVLALQQLRQKLSTYDPTVVPPTTNDFSHPTHS